MAYIERRGTAHRDMTSVTVKSTANIEATETATATDTVKEREVIVGTARGMEVAV